MKKSLLFVLLFVFTISGCSKEEQLSANAERAKKHLEEMQFVVISHEGEGSQQFSKEDLLTMPHYQTWAVQYVEPDNYLNKQIDTVSFTIKNHPLDDAFKMGKTHATVFLYNGEVIGGWSYPMSKDDDVVGAPSSLDGKTLEEIHGMSYAEWFEMWTEKYSQ